MKTIFASGSCRLLTTINYGYDKIIPLHSLFYNFIGINFLGKLHNTKQHIQFIKFIQDKIIIPDNILSKFLTCYSDIKIENVIFQDKQTLYMNKDNINNNFNNCDLYIFEICSLKLYLNNNFQVQHELTTEYDTILQTAEDLYQDLIIIRNLIPVNKKILFQVHFRPNIIYNNNEIINNREIIYNVITDFCNNNKNSYIYDPSILLRKNTNLFDGDTHFNNMGYIENFNYIYDNFIVQ